MNLEGAKIEFYEILKKTPYLSLNSRDNHKKN